MIVLMVYKRIHICGKTRTETIDCLITLESLYNQIIDKWNRLGMIKTNDDVNWYWEYELISVFVISRTITNKNIKEVYSIHSA